MVYKTAIGVCKQLFQSWKIISFINASQYFGYFAGSNHEHTLSEPTVVANSADWLHLQSWIPIQPWNMPYCRPQGSLIPGKTSFAIYASQHLCDLLD